jgi:hypothetical protein
MIEKLSALILVGVEFSRSYCSHEPLAVAVAEGVAAGSDAEQQIRRASAPCVRKSGLGGDVDADGHGVGLCLGEDDAA